MTVRNSVITPEKDMMIDMLLHGDTITSIAESCHVSRQSIYAWKSEPVVIAELNRRREALKKTSSDMILSYVPDCVKNVYELASGSGDQRVRLQANKFLIEMGLGKAAANTANNNDNDLNDGDNHKNTNDLKKEIDNIREMKAI